MKKFFLISTIFTFFISFIFFFSFNSYHSSPFQITEKAFAQELVEDRSEILKAEVVKINSEEKKNILGTDVETIFQNLDAKILDGERSGEIVNVANDFLKLKVGQEFFLMHNIDTFSGIETYTVKEINRINYLLFFVFVFIFVVIIFSGRQGVRSILSLSASLFIIFYLLLPNILAGYNPIFLSIATAFIILFFAIFFTHGFNKESFVAFLGTNLTVIITGVFAYFAVDLLSLSGFASDEAVYLNFNTRGALDFSGLLFGAIIIGVLGVLDDIAITQSAIVTELYNSNSDISKKDIYKKAMRVGREHIGALINTLALAYTSVSLPLLLLFYTSTSSFESIINQEIFTTEIIRTIIGSTGLILCVPITTLLAVHFLKNYKGKNNFNHNHHTHFH